MEKRNDLRDLILNAREPLIIRNMQPRWSCFANLTLREWCKRFDFELKKPVRFERSAIKCGLTPQWERSRQMVHMGAEQFLNEHSVEQDFWSGLQYKRIEELPSACVDGIDFGIFGFANANEDATLWLSAKGANTPCHYDTYGCNIVCQQYGKKSWLLLPPGAPLITCRVPYEESSVYCKENFYAPKPKDVDSLWQRLKNFAYHCTLEAGDVLIVPRHWWHFVEAVDISLSVNAWLPLAIDVDAQLDECIVKYVMESIVHQHLSCADVVKHLLNPNQLNLIADETQLLQLIEHLSSKQTSDAPEESNKKSEDLENCYPYQHMEISEVDELIARSPNIEKLTPMADADLKRFLQQNAQRFDDQFVEGVDTQSPLDVIRQELLNSICEPRVIATIKAEFSKRLRDI